MDCTSGVTTQSGFFSSACFLNSPPTAPSFVVVVELQQLIGWRRQGQPIAEGPGLEWLDQSHGVLWAVTNPRDPPPSTKKGMTGQSARGLGGINNTRIMFFPIKNAHYASRPTSGSDSSVSCVLIVLTDCSCKHINKTQLRRWKLKLALQSRNHNNLNDWLNKLWTTGKVREKFNMVSACRRHKIHQHRSTALK